MLATTALGNAKTAQRETVKQPSFSLAVELPQVIKAQSEMILEIKMTNISKADISYGVICGWPMWPMFRIDLRDAAGSPVPQTPAGQRISRGPSVVTCAVGFPLAPGKTLSPQLILNRVYDLSRPGEYTVQAHRTDTVSGKEVSSNRISFKVPPSAGPFIKGKPAFSVAVTAPFASVKPGWQIPVEIAVKNSSNKELNLAVWEGQNQDATTKEADEFGSGLEVRDSKGNPEPLTKDGQTLLNGDELPNGSFKFVPIAPGEIVEETRIIGGIYDVRAQGAYSVQVGLTDPTTNLPVKSTVTEVAVTNSAPFHPPFIIKVGPELSLAGDHQFALRICQTNISSRAIKVDNYMFLDEVALLDSRGNPVPLTVEGRRRTREERWFLQRGERGADASHSWELAPGGNLCGASTVNVDWDLSKPGQYSAQIIRLDYPDKAPGQVMEDLPTVKSNTILWSVPSEAVPPHP